MSVLTFIPKPEVFSTVPYLEDAVEDFNEKNVSSIIEGVGEVFLKHKVYNDFGLSIVHRHFDMSPNDEILVETIDDERRKSVAVPWKIEGFSAKPIPEETWTTHGLSTRKFVVPQTWFFNSDGELVPYEFLALEDNAECLPSVEFSKDLYSALKTLGVEKILGLRRVSFIREVNTWETTPEGMRANVTMLGEIADEAEKVNMIKVIWCFNRFGQLRKNGGWCVWCTNSNNCNHCREHKKSKIDE